VPDVSPSLTARGDHGGLFLNGDFVGLSDTPSAAGWALPALSAAAACVGGLVDRQRAGQADGGADGPRPASGSSLVARDKGWEGEEGVVGFCR
jgi:hypothetical protein